MAKKVIIAGAGVAGLSAAHELAKYPNLFEVHVYEKASHCGGKCASQNAPVKGVAGQHLGEHGFRFFPWFYRHLAETLREIPSPSTSDRVFDGLEESDKVGIAVNGTVYAVPRGNQNMLNVDFLKIMELMFGQLKVSIADLSRMAGQYLKFHTSCPARRAEEYENESWADFLGMTANKYAPDFTKLMDSVPMMLVAMQASKGSARTLGNIGIQMLYDFDTLSYDKIDAVLQGPTSIAWLDPWVADLNKQGVHIYNGHELVSIDLAAANPPKPRHVQSVTFRDPSGNPKAVDVSGGYFICAVPIDRIGAFLTPALIGAEPELAKLHQLVATKPWSNMIGAQYFLDVDPPTLKGHVAYPHSDWALTSVSQAQYWKSGKRVDPDLSKQFGISGLKGVISVIACHWDSKVTDPTSPVVGKTASECTEQQVKDEIWRQVVKGAYKNPAGAPVPLDSHLDENVKLPPPTGTFDNPTPLLIHPPKSYPKRPTAGLPKIDNLMLASDYVQTNTELATMEGANEAAKRAVSAIYDAEMLSNNAVPRPGIYELPWDALSEPARKFDCWLFSNGWAHPMHILGIGVQLIPAFTDVPPDFDTFVFDPATQSAVRVNVRSPEASEHLRRYPPPLIAVPSAKIVYAGFPPLDQLPADLDPDVRRTYAQFWENREELQRFGVEPSRAGYRLWERVLGTAPTNAES